MKPLTISDEDLLHYGIPRRSGRYPWGSGEENVYYSNNRTFVQAVQELRNRGFSEKEIYEGFGMKSGEYRATLSNAKAEVRQANIAMATRLKDERGWSTTAIGERMNLPESTVRNLLKDGAADKASKTENTAKVLKNRVDEVKYLDVGKGTETQIGVTTTTWNNAVSSLRAQGYELHEVRIQQPGIPGQYTNFKILAPPGTTQKEVFLNQNKIQQLNKFTDDNGRNFYGLHPPIQVNKNRLDVVYAEQGGSQSDGVIYVRPGVKDLSLGDNTYAQVRVQVGPGHYIKGMAVYKSDLPDGVDLQFHTNKPDTGNKLDALKPIKEDANNPFGTVVRQIVDHPGTPKEKVTSAMNLVNEQGQWAEWNRTVSSQMLSKQKPILAKTQLSMTFEEKESALREINSLTNATVKKKLLLEFADSTDSSAVHLKARSFPGQATHVILPINSMKEHEVFAPNYNNGDRVVLVRYPHGGPFEIPELTVNNRNHEARRSIGPDSKDAIGIHHKVANRLSGADFDGDTVMVIPTAHTNITTRKPLEGLKDFDPSRAYPGYPGMKAMKNTQTEMGKISNLITDMSLRNASDAELTRAVKHSMVVIDAEKKGLNHRLSYNDNNIGELKRKYQPRDEVTGKAGASSLISRKKQDVRLPEMKERPASKGGSIDKATGKKILEPTGRINPKTGEVITKKYARLAVTDDAHKLSSGTPMEKYYADHSNKLKALANEARRISVNTPQPKQNPSARKTYAKEVDSLNAKLAIAIANKPKERQAQIISNTQFRMAKDADPNMDKATEKKIRFQTLQEARSRTGSDKVKIEITEKEWEAIQSGAISHSKLNEILDNSNMETVKKLATPKTQKLMSPTRITRAKQMLNSGFTRAEVASQLGVSLSTLDTAIA